MREIHSTKFVSLLSPIHQDQGKAYGKVWVLGGGLSLFQGPSFKGPETNHSTLRKHTPQREEIETESLNAYNH